MGFHSGRAGNQLCVGGRWPRRVRGEAGIAHRSARGSLPGGPPGRAWTVPFVLLAGGRLWPRRATPQKGLQVLAEARALATTRGTLLGGGDVSAQGELLYSPASRAVCGLDAGADPVARREAETWLQPALDVAHRQEAKSLELRAAMSLSRLWQQQGKRAEARDLLAPIYCWFTEGFDTPDLQDAKALLDELK